MPIPYRSFDRELPGLRSHVKIEPQAPVILSKVVIVKSDPKLTTYLYPAGILALTFLLNASALDGFWRFDDGYLLDYASRFSPWDYFFNPAITRGYSLNNLTPFNPLIYDLNLSLFGFHPRGFYLVHLLTLAGCGIASYFLIKLWTPAALAFLGSVCFLAGAPTLFVAQQLMVGHYITGLLFTILASYCYALSLKHSDRRLVVLTALFYIFATACKEVYFPLPFVLVFFNLGGWRRRFLHALPLFVWSLGYLLWRTVTLGSLVGGYDGGAREFSVYKALTAYLGIPQLLLGSPVISAGLMIIVLALAVYLAMLRRLNLPLMLTAVLAVLLPLAPLTHFPGLGQPNRYLLLPWWLFSLFLTIAVGLMPRPGTSLKSLMLAGCIALSLAQAWHVQVLLQPKLQRFDTVYGFFLNAPMEQLYYARHIKDAYYLDTVLNGARYAQARVSSHEPQRRGLLVNNNSLGIIDRSRFSIMAYDEDCACMTPVASAHHKPNHKTVNAQLLSQPLSPPYPPLFSALEGKMHPIRLLDSSVTIEGEWRGPLHDAEYELILITPGRPQRHKVRLFTDSDPTWEQASVGFTLNLYFADPNQARLAAAQSCLLIRSVLTPLRLLLDGAPSQCQGLLADHP